MDFGYDANGRMVKASKANVPDAVSVYDAAGMRVAERVNDVWRFSIYDIGGKMVAEYGGVAAADEGGVKYLLSDWQGSTRAVLSNGGFVKARMDYTAYGEEIASGVGLRTPALGYSATSGDSLRQRYGLTERDDASGLDHTWFRKNENRGGRWTSPDPYNGSISLGDPQSFNRYSYVANQPTNFIDPSGLFIQRRCRAEFKWIPDNEGSGDWTIVETCFLVDDGLGGSHAPPIIDEAIAGSALDQRQRDLDNKLNNCQINAMGDWAKANIRARSDYKRSHIRTIGVGVIGALVSDGVGGLIFAGGSLYFGYQDYQIALGRNNDDLVSATRKCLGDNPYASRSAKNRAINETNTNVGGTPIPYVN